MLKKVSLRTRLVLFTTVLALVTYATSAVFIYFLEEYIRTIIPFSEFWYVLVVLFLGVIWSGILAYSFAGFITKPIVKLTDVATKIADGDLNHDIEEPNRQDEISALTLAFKRMVDQLKMILTDIEKHATETSDSVQNMKQAALKSREQTDILEETVTQISVGAEETSNAIQQTVEKIEISTTLATQVDGKAEESQKKSAEMVNQLNESKEAITALIDGVNQLAENQDKALLDVERLSKTASEVENVISLVGDISEQTNLLALNASIEASRAGEEGRGFAVVAEEVRKLADQSFQAVQTISDLIQDMQKDVQLVVDSMRNQVDEARNEVKNGQQTNTAIGEMSTVVLQVAAEIKEISQLVDRQLQEMEATNSDSQNVAAIAEETSAGTEEMRATIEEQANFAGNLENLAISLENQTHDLKLKINQFKLK